MSNLALTSIQRVGRCSTSPLQLHRNIKSFRDARRKFQQDISIGFVPTMGALHEGHLSLVREARHNNDIVVASIFVNPTQFGEGEDLDKYPRTLEKDTALLNDLGVDHVFAPDKESMYGNNHVTFVDPTGFDSIPEGSSRPGHFRGVATIVTKLFNIVKPTNAYFGQKDAAQCVLIKRIVKDLDMEDDLNVVVMDTVREIDGLAMSSRNAYLTSEERHAAPIVYKSLCAARDVYYASQMSESVPFPSSQLLEATMNVLNTEPLVTEVQYVSIGCKETMRPIELVFPENGAILSIACKIGSVRLIDNIVI